MSEKKKDEVEEIDLSPEDEEILDRVWDKIAAENRKKKEAEPNDSS